jgi:hypothetical protein
MSDPMRPSGAVPSPAEILRNQTMHAHQQAQMQEAMRYATPYDPSPEYLRETSQATRDTKELLDALVQHALDTDALERRMLWWTKVGVLLAAVAALASLVSIVLAIAL